MTDNNKPVDDATGTTTTGHDWDGITELDTPLPRWWLWTMYATIIWGIGYMIAYPAWPMITDATKGVLGYSTRAEVAQAIEAHAEQNAEIAASVAVANFATIATKPEMDAFARSGGAAVFRTYCSQCHGAGGAGAKGYANLLDDDWLWGGTHEDIYQTLRVGIRWEGNDETRYSEMPAFGDDEILGRAEIEAVADHVLSLSGAAEANAQGAELYADNCAACHGEDATGDRSQGAPNLADAIWLYGGDRETVIATITHSRFGVMPAWSTRLSETELRQVAHFVHSLGGGE